MGSRPLEGWRGEGKTDFHVFEELERVLDASSIYIEELIIC
jgi:hypothetical protein